MIAKYPSKKATVDIRPELIHQTKSVSIDTAGIIFSRNISVVDPCANPIIIQ